MLFMILIRKNVNQEEKNKVLILCKNGEAMWKLAMLMQRRGEGDLLIPFYHRNYIVGYKLFGYLKDNNIMNVVALDKVIDKGIDQFTDVEIRFGKKALDALHQHERGQMH
jgi:hypothetical protein